MTDEGPTPEKRPRRKTQPATPAVQAWLDGEEPRDHLNTTDENETAELWTRINTETEQLRRRATPIHLQQKILSALPDLAQQTAPSPFPKAGLSPVVLAIGGIAALVIGALAGMMLVR